MSEQKQVKREEDLVGKTIAEVADEGDSFVLRFTDGSYAVLAADGGGCGEDLFVYVYLDPHAPTPQILHAAGVLSDADFQAWQDQQRENDRALRRLQWETLQKEFGATPPREPSAPG